uniref:hypothetical protein n=1 Tax=Altererythrobacter segetis TaxID=1104773 RepID=UPI00140AAC94|nr:hypothetical protein [Altererythrobacter segetis]
MKIFRATELRINPIPIVADDIHHASHSLLFALYEGLRHWPGVSYSIGPWEPPCDMAPDILKKVAEEHAGGLAHFVEDGWEVIRSDPHRTW